MKNICTLSKVGWVAVNAIRISALLNNENLRGRFALPPRTPLGLLLVVVTGTPKAPSCAN